MATISFSVNFTLPEHDVLTQQCVVFYVGATKIRDCYNPAHSVNAVQSWSVFCQTFTSGATHVFNGAITTDLEIDSQCLIRLQIYAIPCCFLVEGNVTESVLPCTSVTYPPTPVSLLTNPGISSYTHVINPNNTYSNCRRYIIGTNGSPVTVTSIQHWLCAPADAYYCSNADFDQNVNPHNIPVPPTLQGTPNYLLNTPVPNGTNINNCAYSNPQLDNLQPGQHYFPPYGIIKLCGHVNNPPILTGSGGSPLVAGTDYNMMTNNNVHCDECCHKCREYRVIFSLDHGCSPLGEQYFAYQDCRRSYRLQIQPISPGQNITVCAVEGTITWLTTCLASNGVVTYLGNCNYTTGVPNP